jgi:iron complex outermembrane recepter protein
MRTRKARIVCAAGLAAGLLGPSLAAGEEAREPIEEVIVHGSGESLTLPGPAAAREALQRTPGAVDLVDASEFRSGRAANLRDVLGFVPGVFVQTKYGEDARLSIRGSGLSRSFHLRGVKLLLDGVPINTSDGSGDFQEIEPLAAQYVEVLKGANALEQGSAYLGGAINMAMTSGLAEKPTIGRFELGSFGYQRAQLATGSSEGSFDWFGTATQIRQEGFREHSDQSNLRFSGNFGWRLSETAETRLYLTWNDVNQEIPGSLTRTAALRSPDESNELINGTNVRNDQSRDIQSVRVGSKTTLALGDTTGLTFGGYALSKQLDHPIFQVIDSRYRDFGGFSRLTHQTELGGRNLELLGGVHLAGGTTDAKRFVNTAGEKGAPTADAEERAFTGDGYAQARLELFDNLTGIVGGSYTFALRSVDDRFLSDGDDSDRATYREFSPRVGFLWQSDPSWQVFGNVSRSAEVPTLSEINPNASPGFQELDAQKASTVELGARGRTDWLSWDVAVYRATLRDELQLFVDPNTQATFALNAERTIHQGVEAGFDVRVAQGVFTSDDGDAIWFRQMYTFSDFRFKNDPTFFGNDLPGAPRHDLRSELMYEHGSGFSLSMNLEWVPKGYYVDNANTVKTEDYALFGMRARLPLPGDLVLFLDGRNLFDRKYISSTSAIPVAAASSALFNPGDGRAFYVGVEMRR